MACECEFCGKKTTFGRQYTRKGLAKKKGGNGRKITGKSNRTFKPNVQRVRTFEGGTTKWVKVCAKCIRAGKITKPPKMKQVLESLKSE